MDFVSQKRKASLRLRCRSGEASAGLQSPRFVRVHALFESTLVVIHADSHFSYTPGRRPATAYSPSTLCSLSTLVLHPRLFSFFLRSIRAPFVLSFLTKKRRTSVNGEQAWTENKRGRRTSVDGEQAVAGLRPEDLKKWL